jgi:hypothetical protein
MTGSKLRYPATLLAAGLIAAAPASQSPTQPSLVGIWSGYMTTKQGIVPITAQFRDDGSFDTVMLAVLPEYPSPIYEHFWGRYRLRPAGRLRYALELRPSGQAPSEICWSIHEGAMPDCRPRGMSVAVSKGSVQFLSADRYRDETGTIFTRIDTPGLLAQRVPGRLVIAPPVQSGICSNDGGGTSCARQPHIPPMEPVRCPDGRYPIVDRDGQRTCA